MTTLEILKTTRAAWPSVRDIPEESRNRLLMAMADRLLSESEAILAANRLDLEAARGSISEVMLDRLRLDEKRLEGMADGVRAIVMPATQEVELQCIREGLAEIFIEAGAIISTPTCGPCLGGHMGILAAGDRAISTTNRNFVGRMGHVESEVYLSSPAVAAASAITGYITDPASL